MNIQITTDELQQIVTDAVLNAFRSRDRTELIVYVRRYGQKIAAATAALPGLRATFERAEKEFVRADEARQNARQLRRSLPDVSFEAATKRGPEWTNFRNARSAMELAKRDLKFARDAIRRISQNDRQYQNEDPQHPGDIPLPADVSELFQAVSEDHEESRAVCTDPPQSVPQVQSPHSQAGQR